MESNAVLQDLLLAHKVIESGLPNRYRCQIPLVTDWKLDKFQQMLEGYDDQEVIEWLRYGFSVSRQDSFPHLMPAASNHLGAMLFPEVIDEYIKKEVALGVTIGPFKIPPFFGGVGSPPYQPDQRESLVKDVLSWTLAFHLGPRLMTVLIRIITVAPQWISHTLQSTH